MVVEVNEKAGLFASSGLLPKEKASLFSSEGALKEKPGFFASDGALYGNPDFFSSEFVPNGEVKADAAGVLKLGGTELVTWKGCEVFAFEVKFPNPELLGEPNDGVALAKLPAVEPNKVVELAGDPKDAAGLFIAAGLSEAPPKANVGAAEPVFALAPKDIPLDDTLLPNVNAGFVFPGVPLLSKFDFVATLPVVLLEVGSFHVLVTDSSLLVATAKPNAGAGLAAVNDDVGEDTRLENILFVVAKFAPSPVF